jgi:trigger factor
MVMKHTLSHPSETQVEVSVTVDASELKTARQHALQKLSKSVKAPGFRVGKVPADVAAKHVDPVRLANETAEAAINTTLTQIVQSEDLRILDRPHVDLKTFEPYTSLEFTATIDIVPTVTLGDYKKLTVKRDKVAVTDDEVDEVIMRTRKQLAEKKDVTRAAKDGDQVTIDFVGKKDGTPFDGGTATGYELELGSGNFIPGFEEAIIGHKTGEQFEVPLKFPDDYHVDDLKGADVVFDVTLHGIKEIVLPEVNDELAAKVGTFSTVDGMREDIRAQLVQEKERASADTIKDQLVEQLVSASSVPIPPVLVADQMKQIEQDSMQNLMYRGMSPEQYIAQQGYKDHDEWREKEFKVAAERRVQAGLALAELSKVEKIEVTKDELDTRHAEMLQQYPSMKAQLDAPEARRDLANRVITEKTVQRLVELNIK